MPSLERWMETSYCRSCPYVVCMSVYIHRYICAVHSQECMGDFTDLTYKKEIVVLESSHGGR